MSAEDTDNARPENGASSDSLVGALALRHGIDPMRPSPDGTPVAVSDESKRKLLTALGVGAEAENRPRDMGLNRDGWSGVENSPFPCFLPEFFDAHTVANKRVWGLSLQLYELRSDRNWGIGDFEDLKVMIDLVSAKGGDFIGLNPLHAPFLADPDRCSPYEPSNRQFLNPLYIAVDKLPGFESSDHLQGDLARLRKTDLVDYEGVTSMKIRALRAAWMRWESDDGEDQDDFRNFRRLRGEALERHALFEALSAEIVRRGRGAGWDQWPQDYRDYRTSAVRPFAEEHAEEVRFHAWLQWIAHRQLTDAADHARASGLRIGLYLDLAVGEALDGSATWSEPDAYLIGATVGSPPDPFAPDGQDWHLAGFQPARIAEGDDPPFKRMVAAAMRYAGAIRIDHAAALYRLFLVPTDAPPAEGAYVSYPRQALFKILAETSTQYRCIVIGEDLGLLPEGLQDDLAAARILSYRIFSYERDGSGFKPASAYPKLALACISTHDHQTLAGWWRGADIAARADHGIVSPELTRQHRTTREAERSQLLDAIGKPAGGGSIEDVGETDLNDLTIGAYRFIAETPSLLVAVRLADLTDEPHPTNIPGTRDSYPNWKPKLSKSVAQLPDLPLLKTVLKAVNDGRKTPAAQDHQTTRPGSSAQTDEQKLDAIVEKYSDKIPRPMGRFIRWMRRPDLRWLRAIVGVALVLSGFVGFLPVLGFWMVPLGLIVLAQDSQWLRRPTLKAITWLEKKFKR